MEGDRRRQRRKRRKKREMEKKMAKRKVKKGSGIQWERSTCHCEEEMEKEKGGGATRRSIIHVNVHSTSYWVHIICLISHTCMCLRAVETSSFVISSLQPYYRFMKLWNYRFMNKIYVLNIKSRFKVCSLLFVTWVFWCSHFLFPVSAVYIYQQLMKSSHYWAVSLQEKKSSLTS